MKKNKVKLGLSLLMVLATPIVASEVVNDYVHAAEYKGETFYHNNQPANWWYNDGTGWYFFQNGKKFTGYGKDNAGTHYFVNGKYGEEKKVSTTGYVNGVYYVNGKVANWWYDDGTDWFFFQNGKKFTGYGKDNVGTHYFANGKYGEEKKVPTTGYVNGVYYVNGKVADWWYDDGTDWFFFQNGKKFTGYGKDNAGDHHFVNGKYENIKEDSKNTKRAIFLDPGHGGSDTGAVANGVREKDLTLSVYNKVSSRLASLGYLVLTSRNTDKDVGLVNRADQANKSNADMFLSIHFNAGGRGAAYGIETYYYRERSNYIPTINKDKHNNPERLEKSRKLAQKIQQSLVNKTGAYDRGVKSESFAVLRKTSIPSILVELGFIDNPWEVSKIKTNEYQEKLADGIVNGIVEYYK